MESNFIAFIYLILIILALVMLANKLKLAYPIVLVVGGLALSLTAKFSNIRIDPNLVFFIFLPPLLYEAAWQTSWKDFWKWRRVITSFAFPIVIITSCAIALVSWAILPGFTLALGFLLGGIISPPDAISATTIMRQVNAPKSLISIIEGESLLNDASSLIVFRFALAAVLTGQFHLQQAAWTFLLVVVMGIVIGLAVAMIFYYIHRLLPTTTSIEIVLTLVTPYCMYYAAEHFHFSGVLAVVSGGLLLSHRRQRMLNYRSRIEGINVWSNMVFVFNGLVFLLIGLQLPVIVQQLDIGLGQAIAYGLIISLALILIRLCCTFGAALFTKFISRYITVADANPTWQMPLIAGWAGMRGVVSLAAALSIPLLLENGTPFPHRNLILFITFVVILVTLVFQGLTLPWLIRKLKVRDRHRKLTEHQQELIIQKKIAKASMEYLDEVYADNRPGMPHLSNLYERYQMEHDYFSRAVAAEPTTAAESIGRFRKAYLELLEVHRKLLEDMNHKEEFDEELIRKYLGLIDLEEYKVREKLAGAAD